ncbi:uncharacterized protein LOC127122086 [Lathyrus oleraceus]|uniref:uncharacterized protein LOC127122086 n=1 Tax=Pisum sativum TaxID=3888 RepID=UPI0021D137D8|nr:uncharacterized protein LOC127122086 [Pisum sativum]
MKIGESVNDYFERVMETSNDMSNYRENMSDVKIVEKILRSLTEKFNFIVCSIEESKDIDLLIVDELQSSLLIHEKKAREKEANYAEFDEEEELLLMFHVEVQDIKHKGTWFLDFGCSNHMKGNKKWFVELDETSSCTVGLGNNSRMSVMGKGSVRFEVGGIILTVSDVYFVPDLTNNLLSIVQLQERCLKKEMVKAYQCSRKLQGFVKCVILVKHLRYSNASRIWLRKKLRNIYVVYEQTGEENSPLTSSISST